MMKQNSVLIRLVVIVVIMVFGVHSGHSQSTGSDQKTQNDLYREITRLDSILFSAFNNRNIELFKTMFTEDLEFFHDKGGLTNYDHTINFLKTTAENNNHLRRELVKERLEVYPIPGYGAMEIGEHRFCHTENGKEDCGTFKFVHIWQNKNGQWKISRVVSYGH